MQNKVYIFDFDGTLVDSMSHLLGVLIGFLEEYNISYPDDIVDRIIPMGYRKTAQYYKELGVPMDEDEIFRTLLHRQVELYSSSKIALKDGVLATLKKLYQRGEHLNIFSGSTLEMVGPSAERLEVTGYFENIWAVDSFGTTKNVPGAYKLVAEKLGVKCEDCLFFDDNYANLFAAKEAGMRVFGVKERWSRDNEEKIIAISEKYIQSFSEILDIE